MGMNSEPPPGGYPPPPGAGYPPPSGYPPPPGAGYPPPGAGFAAPMGAYAMPQPFTPTAPPVPAGVGNLFQKWVNVTTKPGVQSFVNEIPTANWGDVWLALLGLGIITAITTVIRSLEFGAAASALYSALPAAQGQLVNNFTAPSVGSGIASIITVPIGFFIGVGILWLFAKMFGGTGGFLSHSYAFSLFYLPLAAVAAVIGIIPFLGGLVGLAISIYSIFLAVFAVSAVHRLTTGKSVAVVLLPAAILAVLACAGIFLLAAVIIGLTGGAIPAIPTP